MNKIIFSVAWIFVFFITLFWVYILNADLNIDLDTKSNQAITDITDTTNTLEKDINIILPVERVKDLKESGEIRDISPRHFSFMGHIKGSNIDKLINTSAPDVAELLKTDKVDIVILTPSWGICNQSVGLIQRIIEEKGIPTISISSSKKITESLRPPRAVYTGFPLGHPLSFPGQNRMQMNVLRFLLKQLKEITEPGTIINFDSAVMHGDTIVCIDNNLEEDNSHSIKYN